jgi:hypothetical protein
MKKTAENRYPYSAVLFKFCKEALEIRLDGNVKVIDQDVGAILGFDPADCSHWKKGKKNIRALSTLKNLADHLNIDERLLIDIAAGSVSLEEAVFEYQGYGRFGLGGGYFEHLKKEYFKNPSRWHGEGVNLAFEELFNLNLAQVVDLVQRVLTMGEFEESPIHLPEVFALFPASRLMLNNEMDKPFDVAFSGVGQSLRLVFSYRGPELRPYVRFLAARELYKFLVNSGHPLAATLRSSPLEILDIQANIFASQLLVPESLFAKELESADPCFDLVGQLASAFWVSTALINQRLTSLLEARQEYSL